MTVKKAVEKLQKKGYRVTFTMTGKVIASKNGRNYTADSINALVKHILG